MNSVDLYVITEFLTLATNPPRNPTKLELDVLQWIENRSAEAKDAQEARDTRWTYLREQEDAAQ